MGSKYKPLPFILSIQNILQELLDHIEEMAQNVHEVWAGGRLQDNWQYGIERNDFKKEHPSLIHYKILTEAEKEYDRNTALATINYIITNGFEIKNKN